MIELISNVLQSTVTLLCGALTGILYYRTRKHTYFALLCFYVCFGLAGLYWTLYLLLYQTTPQVLLVSYIGWNTSIGFLLIMQSCLTTGEERQFKTRLSWLAVCIGLPLTILICLVGNPLSQLISCTMIMFLAWLSIRGLVYGRNQKARKCQGVYGVLLMFAAVELSLWTSACFWYGNTLANPYFWFDFLLTASMAAILPVVKRAVEP